MNSCPRGLRCGRIHSHERSSGITVNVLFRGFHNLLLMCLALGLAACSEPVEWRGTDVTGMFPDLAFELVDSDGNKVTAAQK